MEGFGVWVRVIAFTMGFEWSCFFKVCFRGRFLGMGRVCIRVLVCVLGFVVRTYFTGFCLVLLVVVFGNRVLAEGLGVFVWLRFGF